MEALFLYCNATNILIILTISCLDYVQSQILIINIMLNRNYIHYIYGINQRSRASTAHSTP